MSEHQRGPDTHRHRASKNCVSTFLSGFQIGPINRVEKGGDKVLSPRCESLDEPVKSWSSEIARESLSGRAMNGGCWTGPVPVQTLPDSKAPVAGTQSYTQHHSYHLERYQRHQLDYPDISINCSVYHV